MDSEQETSGEGIAETPLEAMLGAGDRLRAAREAKKLDLAHIASETRIPQRHLASIESGTFEDLPSRTYAIGFARTYARSVGLDEKEIADAVREELAEGAGRQSALAGGMEPGDPAKLPSQGLAWAAAIAALLLAVGAYTFYATYFGSGEGVGSLIADGEDNSDADLQLANTQDADVQAGGEGALSADGQVIFTAQEELWVRFYDQTYDETREPLFEGVMNQGDTFDVPRNVAEPRINTGRPDALTITIDGRSIPSLSDEPITIGDALISAPALLARADSELAVATATN